MKVLFLIQRKKVNKRGFLPIMCRITYQKERKEFSTGIMIKPNWWLSKSQEVNSNTPNSNVFNSRLIQIRQKLNRTHLLLEVQNSQFDVGDILRVYRGETIKREHTLVTVIEEHNRYNKRLIGKELKKVSWQKFENTLFHVKGFLKWKYKQTDIKLGGLRYQFIVDLEYYLKVVENMQQSTINKNTQRFKKMITFAVAQGYISVNPFLLHKPKSVKKDVVYLTANELKAIEEKNINIKRVAEIRDCFVFCCYTGLAFKEMSNLREGNIMQGQDGAFRIQMVRQKTGKKINIPLLPRALKVFRKYQGTLTDDRVLPSKTNAHFNAYLKEIADLCGIQKNLTHHLARKTFATTVLLYNDVPMEIVSKLLGHSRIGITQAHYGEILNEKVDLEIDRLSRILS
ncbi:site-specific integrase [Christiangramia sp. ASW11-125]|uniref:site-specific integrase n=1 Tax=Christiangramia sp. ASW11-125 TaxID=3400701 RepID=UPI003AB0D83D